MAPLNDSTPVPTTPLPKRAATRARALPATLAGFGAATALGVMVGEDAVAAPWRPWGFSIAAACWVSALLAYRQKRAPQEDVGRADPAAAPASALWVDRAGLAWVALPFLLGILVVLEFVKDDAYISFRYAHNLVTGRGLVFNTGERLEGFTNFLWVLILAPFEALGLDLFQVCEVLGTALGIATLAVTARMTAWVRGERRTFFYAHLWGAFWLGASSSFVLWAKSGLEQPLAVLLPMAGAWMLWASRESPRDKAGRSHLAAGLVMGAGCMTRPELHLMAILVGLPLVADAVRARRVARPAWLYVAGILAATVPCHTFRLAYYGTLIPNTYYVKTGTGSEVVFAGLRTLREMFDFNQTGLLVAVAPLAFADGRRILVKSTMALVAAAFMAYYVRVGVDEMQWHRLYLPALPFLCVLAALGLQNGLLALRDATGAGRGVAFGVGWAAVLLASAASFRFTYDEQNGFNGHGDLAGTYHPDLGKFLVRHERPGALVAFQDMGSTPYHAPDINFLDFFGLVDRTVAHARHDYGLHTFVGGGRNQARFDAEMREYFFSRNPEWTILTIYTPSNSISRVAHLFESDPTGATFGDDYRDNGWQFGIWDDPRFQQRYVPVRTWPRSASYYLALWRRRDLWDQAPGEVLLDAEPQGKGGVRAEFEGGLSLLGSELTHETVERGEALITTWWSLPGPMPRDLMFFVHVNGNGLQVPGDHVPGDWMYPADRWLKGQILEDRMLFQLPPMIMNAGHYAVSIGAYSRSTGKRLAVINGPSDGQDRVALGSLEVKPLYPLIDPLIPPTRVSEMRKYPDRIVDSGRRP